MQDILPVKIDAHILATAFPSTHRIAAITAGSKAARTLAPKYWRGQFATEVEGETVLIPTRLHFARYGFPLLRSNQAWLFLRALKTRSTNGFERQRALRDLLQQPKAWTAPFIVKLIGEYLIEILEDVSAAMTPELEQILADFIVNNGPFWNTTKRRVISYWNAYYRARWLQPLDRAERRDEYVGFRLIQKLEAAASLSVSQQMQ